MSSIIDVIRKEIRNHPSNMWATEKGWEPLFSAHEDSKVVIVGQAPGIKAQESMKPWDDVSGKKLRSWLGTSDEEFYDVSKFALIPMDFYFPGKGKTGDLPPRKEFAEMWHTKLFEAMPNIELIILVGQYSQKYYLADMMKRNLTETVRSYEEYLPKYFPLPHPSPLNGRWLKRNPWFEESILDDLRIRILNKLYK